MSAEKSLVELTTEIVSSQLRHQAMSQKEIIALMDVVFDALNRLQHKETSQMHLSSSEMLIGKINHYRRDKGFGFITSENEENYFFHISSIENEELKKRLSLLEEIDERGNLVKSIDVFFDSGGYETTKSKYEAAINIRPM